ncbi:MAG: glycosyltransferase [Candidatus Altiarchaeota archaeon]|nr:glycosyltransferase [Candidatus Altiarchaeota archaeon]
MKIQLYMCGEGLGHTSRCLALGKELLNAGHELTFHAYGSSKSHIEKNGYPAIEIPSEIKLIGKAGSLDINESMKASITDMEPLGLPKVINQVREGRPDMLISDSYFLAIIAAKLQGVPAYLIANQTNTYKFFENRGVSAELAGKLLRHFMDAVFNNVQKVIIPDFPPPWTICKSNVEELGEILNYSGPLVMNKPEDVKAAELARPHVLSLVGGFGYREKLLVNLLEVARENPKLNFTMLAGPNVNPEKLKNHPKNVTVIDYLPNIASYLKSTDVVIAPGGHSTMMECMTYGVPLISFPDMNHSEQANNAEQLDILNVGRRLSYHTPAFMISDAIKELLDDSAVRKNCQRLKEYAKRLDGAKNIKKLIEDKGK